MKKGAIVLLFIGVLSFPFFLWHFDEKISLNVVLLNKTTNGDSFREHHGITWALNYLRYEKNDEPYDVSNDVESNLPLLDDADMIYIADTYGGALKMDEWMSIGKWLQSEGKSTLIVEHDTLSPPTEENVRASIRDFFHLRQTGWKGKIISKVDELSSTIVELYEKETGEKWGDHKEGVILVNEREQKVIFLKTEEHVDRKGLTVTFTDRGKQFFGLEESAPYAGWFDIATSTREDEVLAKFQLHLTEKGDDLLAKHGIPPQFVAVTTTGEMNDASYYFAGDFSKIAQVPSFFQYKGLAAIKSFTTRFNREEHFYWNTFIPMMRVIFSQKESSPVPKQKEVDVANDGGLSYVAKVEDETFDVFVDGEWKSITIKGVNIGMGKPGAFPGEAAIREDEYYRWFKQISAMGANAIRNYTIHPPDFYRALKRFNEENEKPLYLFHGVWIDEEPLEATLDAFDEQITKQFQEEMERIVDIIHGNATIPHRPGHAHGFYNADISPYVIGWIIGIEWYPYMVDEMSKKYAGLGDYDGTYVKTIGAEPFEYWLAEQFDHLLTFELERYGWIRPISFTNWVTTDLLHHPAEPNEQEDLASVNPNVIHLKEPFTTTGQFASYHVYPYYPDFLNYEERYVNFIDHRGEKNNYAAYLKDLHEAHDIPVLIAEFGVPSSRGLTHENPFGWNQGGNSEKEQGEIIVRLFEDIVHEGMLGGLIFTWQDEWFKRTWNTMDYDNPDRRPFWSNTQTNEQFFGLLSFDRNKIKVDGKVEDWEEIAPFYEGKNETIKSLYVTHDERFLYFRIDYDKLDGSFPLFLLDTVSNQGNSHADIIKDLAFSNEFDYMIKLNGKDDSVVLVDAYYDIFTQQYEGDIDDLPNQSLRIKNSGLFYPIYYALNKELFIPSQNRTIPFSYYETGKLRHGNGNPEDENYDSLADFYINEKDGIIEMRIPWLLLQFRDPSQREVMANLHEGWGNGEFIDGIGIGLLLVSKDGTVVESYPQRKGNVLPTVNTYTWETWNTPLYEERLKQSYYIVQKKFKES